MRIKLIIVRSWKEDVSKQRFSITTRAALWRAYDCKCFYCETPISFCDLEIDHIVPESLSRDSMHFQELLAKLGLPKDFEISALNNLVPTHARCNRRKSDTRFSESALRYYLELASSKLPRAQREARRLKVQAQNESLLLALGHRIEQGALSTQEVVRFLSLREAPEHAKLSDPLAICLCANVSDLQGGGQLPKEAPVGYPQLCDWLERQLLRQIRSNGVAVATFCEASARNGETLAVRIAAWAMDADSICDAAGPWWSVTEVAAFSDIYQVPPDSLFEEALVQTANSLVYAPGCEPPYRRCPRCGSRDLETDTSSCDHLEDDEYWFVKCRQCGWSDWHS